MTAKVVTALRGDLPEGRPNGRFPCCLLGIRVFYVTNDGRKSFGHCSPDYLDGTRTRERRSLNYTQVKMERRLRHCSSFLNENVLIFLANRRHRHVVDQRLGKVLTHLLFLIDSN